MFKRWLLAAGVVALAAPAMAASTITFDDSVTVGNPILTSFNSGGFTFTGQHFHIVDNPGGFGGVVNGTQYLAAEFSGNLGKPVDFAPTGGGTFSLNRADIAELFLAGNDFFDVVFVGTVSGGGTLTQSFRLDGIKDGAGGAPDFQSVSFTGWSNLTNVNVRGALATGAFGDFSIDNILVNATTPAVPEPATWGMMLAGFGIVGGAMRRRQRVSVSFG
jgi:PEP-CTERM motif